MCETTEGRYGSKGLQAIGSEVCLDTHITYTDIKDTDLKIRRSEDPKDTKTSYRNPCRHMEMYVCYVDTVG
jgi:hypothetical protein